jgi:hypothetical protein
MRSIIPAVETPARKSKTTTHPPAVGGDDEFPCLLKVGDMPGVEDIETAIGHDLMGGP